MRNRYRCWELSTTYANEHRAESHEEDALEFCRRNDMARMDPRPYPRRVEVAEMKKNDQMASFIFTVNKPGAEREIQKEEAIDHDNH